MTQGNINGLSDGYDLNYLNQQLNVNIPSGTMFDWNEFYLYNTLPGLHKTQVFEEEIENNSAKKELYKAYQYVGREYLKKNCN